MTNNDLPVLDIATKMYKYENEFVEFENISKYNKYEIHKLNAAG